jgi:hypothetical protein
MTSAEVCARLAEGWSSAGAKRQTKTTCPGTQRVQTSLKAGRAMIVCCTAKSPRSRTLMTIAMPADAAGVPSSMPFGRPSSPRTRSNRGTCRRRRDTCRPIDQSQGASGGAARVVRLHRGLRRHGLVLLLWRARRTAIEGRIAGNARAAVTSLSADPYRLAVTTRQSRTTIWSLMVRNLK